MFVHTCTRNTTLHSKPKLSATSCLLVGNKKERRTHMEKNIDSKNGFILGYGWENATKSNIGFKIGITKMGLFWVIVGKVQQKPKKKPFWESQLFSCDIK